MIDETNIQLKRVLILGHKGFIGQHFEKHFRSIVVEVEVIGKDLPDVDLTLEAELNKIADLFDRTTVEIMLSAIKRQFADTLDAFSQNLMMTTNLCRLF